MLNVIEKREKELYTVDSHCEVHRIPLDSIKFIDGYAKISFYSSIERKMISGIITKDYFPATTFTSSYLNIQLFPNGKCLVNILYNANSQEPESIKKTTITLSTMSDEEFIKSVKEHSDRDLSTIPRCNITRGYYLTDYEKLNDELAWIKEDDLSYVQDFKTGKIIFRHFEVIRGENNTVLLVLKSDISETQNGVTNHCEITCTSSLDDLNTIRVISSLDPLGYTVSLDEFDIDAIIVSVKERLLIQNAKKTDQELLLALNTLE